MNKPKMLEGLVRKWEAEDGWVDRGRWTRAENGAIEYLPTKREMAAVWKFFGTISGWRGQAGTVWR